MDNLILTPIPLPELKNLIRGAVNEALKEHQPPTEDKTPVWLNLQQFCDYHPDHPKPPTVYGWLSGKNKKDDFPVHKDGKKLRFLKSEVDAWLLKGKRKNQFEINRVVDRAITSHIK